MDLTMVSGRCRLKAALEDSTKRRRHGSISTWEDLTTCFLAQLFPPERIAKLRNGILMFQQHQEASLSEEWTRFMDLFQKRRGKKNDSDNITTDDSIKRPDGSNTEMPLKEVEKENKVENETKNEPIESAEKELMRAEEEEAVESSSS
nr:zinc finger, CCHC-type [Tanacetum cinerariifolium]